MPNTLILGIGNTLLSDEGIGIHILNYLSKYFSDIPGVRYVDGGTLSFTLAPEIERADNLIVLDAARFGKPPGTVRCVIDDEFDVFIGKPKLSPHEVGLADLIDIAILTESLPQRRAMIGIEPKHFDWGETPSKELSAAIPVAANKVNILLQRWGVIPECGASQQSIKFLFQAASV